MVTRMEFHARSITIFATAANCSFFFTYLRISRSLCKNAGSSCGDAYQRERQSRFTPRRNPIGLTFCPIKNQCVIPSEIIPLLFFHRSFLPSAFFPSRLSSFQLFPRLLPASWTLSFPVLVSFSSFPAFRFESHRLTRCEYDSCALKCGCHCRAHAPSSA